MQNQRDLEPNVNTFLELGLHTALIGGALIGLSALLLMLLHGRILGATGILSGLVFVNDREDWSWRAALVLGMVLATVALGLIGGASLPMTVDASPLMIIAGGLLVGVGTSLGSGCTSGHGICGLARMSLRSLIAVLVFMTSAAVTVFVIRHVLGVGQ